MSFLKYTDRKDMFYFIAVDFQADKSIQAKQGYLLYNKMYYV